MKLSTRGRYGIHAMYDLARNAEYGPQSIKAIAEREGIPEAYLEQLIAPLKRAGLVISTRGAQGGYTLARAPEEITVGDVLRALEGGLNLVDCLDEEDACGKSCACASRMAASSDSALRFSASSSAAAFFCSASSSDAARRFSASSVAAA